MAAQFILIDCATPYISPPCVQDYLPEDHLAYFVVDFVDQLALYLLSAVYVGKGKRPYHPAMLFNLVVLWLGDWRVFQPQARENDIRFDGLQIHLRQ